MIEITYTKKPNVEQLEGEIKALDLAGFGGLSWTGDKLVVRFGGELDDKTKAALDKAISGHAPTQPPARAPHPLESEIDRLDITNAAQVRRVLKKIARLA